MLQKKSLILYVLCLTAALCLILFAAWQFFFHDIQPEEVVSAPVTPSAPQSDISDCIALLGIDTEDGEAGRSDAVLLVTVDRTQQTVRICSIARDTRVEIGGHGTGKLNAAYAYGGGALLLETLQEQFDLPVTHYAAVNFSGMAEIVDLLGGVELTLSEAEAEVLQLSAGAQRLDGAQAVRYSRIRKIDNDDVRTSRQRKLLQALMNQSRTLPDEELPQLLQLILGQCTTDLTQAELLALLAQLTPDSVRLKEHAIPSAQTDAEGKTVDGIWYYLYDTHAAGAEIRSFLGISAQNAADS